MIQFSWVKAKEVPWVLHKNSSSSSYFATKGSQPVCLDIGSQSGADEQIFIAVVYLESSCCGAPFLKRERICNLLVQFIVTFRSKSRRTHDHILLSHWDSRNLEGQVSVFMYLIKRVVQLYPRTLRLLFVASYDPQGYGGVILPRLHTGNKKILVSPTRLFIHSSGRSRVRDPMMWIHFSNLRNPSSLIKSWGLFGL
jgi:hypothetical protein